MSMVPPIYDLSVPMVCYTSFRFGCPATFAGPYQFEALLLDLDGRLVLFHSILRFVATGLES
jgi:hypothetical protein